MEKLIFLNLLPSDQLIKSSQGDIWWSQFEYIQWGIFLWIEENFDKTKAAIIQDRGAFHFSDSLFVVWNVITVSIAVAPWGDLPGFDKNNDWVRKKSLDFFMTQLNHYQKMHITRDIIKQYKSLLSEFSNIWQWKDS